MAGRMIVRISFESPPDGWVGVEATKNGEYFPGTRFKPADHSGSIVFFEDFPRARKHECKPGDVLEVKYGGAVHMLTYESGAEVRVAF